MLSGRCLCGAVSYETADEPVYIFNCYCATCRRESGAGHATIVSVKEAGLKINGVLKVVAPARENGADPIPRSFCPACGTTLFARPKAMPGMVNLRAGTLDGATDLKIQKSFCVSDACSWDRPPVDVPGEG